MTIQRLALVTLTLGAMLACAGCNIVGPAFVLIHGPPKIAAQYKLDPEKKTVVFVDDRANIIPRRSTRLRIAAAAEQGLVENGVVKEVIRSQAIITAASLDSHANPRSIAQLGRDVGADVVIYATADFFGLSPDGATYQPTSQLRVKVIDATTGDRLWPEDQPQGFQLFVQMQVRADEMPTTTSGMQEREAKLAEWTGARLAELFYEHVEANEMRVGSTKDNN